MPMKYFKNYVSNTTASSGNQLFFDTGNNQIKIGRAFFKINCGGEFDYSFLFTNVIDSTYADGSISRCNLLCDSWQIHHAKVGRCKHIGFGQEICGYTMADSTQNISADIIVSDLKPITFDSKTSKTVNAGETFSSDPIKLSFDKDEFLCLEIAFSGNMIPYHEESILPIYVKTDNIWEYSRQMPLPSIIGCQRSVKARIGYFGDSITQGIGTEYNAYAHWNAVLSEKTGNDYAFWNLGIGYGRAGDGASCGAWLDKAKQNDIIIVCFGVNDIFNVADANIIKNSLYTIVSALKSENKTVIIQTVPPFDYTDKYIDIWEEVNRYINTELSSIVDCVFDTVSFLGDKEKPYNAVYGGHPDAEGCILWAEKLYYKLVNELKII